MIGNRGVRHSVAAAVGLALMASTVAAQQAPAVESDELHQQVKAQGERLDAMRSQIAAQMEQLESMRRTLAAQEAQYRELRQAVGLDVLDRQRAGNIRAAGSSATALPMPADAVVAAGPEDTQPVGQAPQRDSRPPEVAPIFDQPGVLTPPGKLIVEPSYQFGYSSADRVALVGYTIIPAILIGLVDVRQVKTTTQTGAIALRYGITNRMEAEVRIPFVHGHTDTISREIFTGSATDRAFGTSSTTAAPTRLITWPGCARNRAPDAIRSKSPPTACSAACRTPPAPACHCNCLPAAASTRCSRA